MKKMKLAVVFAALTSAFTFSSCLSDGDTSPQSWFWIVNVDENIMGLPTLTPDNIPGATWDPNTTSLTPYGLPEGTKRALIGYTVPEGQDLNAKKIKIDLVAGLCAAYPIFNISNRPDTLDTYKTRITGFVQPVPGIPSVCVNGRYLAIACTLNTNGKVKVGLMPNRVSETKDTLYLDYKINSTEGTINGAIYANYNLTTCNEFYELQPNAKDSIYITVRALASEYGTEKVDSMTARAKFGMY